MEMGVESPDKGRLGGIAMEISVTDGAETWSPPRMPPSLRRRLSEPKSSPTAEEIEAKLRGADLRRQKFYEYLSSKARPKPRSPSQSPSNEEDLGLRLEAKLQAAEQKRLSILAEAQMRLAKLDELRRAARNGVEMQFKKRRAELGTRVEMRVQQAEANRLLILKAYRQRRATLKERISQSLLRRMARESKYKERIRAAISQKRAAAEKKRLGFLEAEKKKACARILQVQKVAKTVSRQREIEQKEMKNKLEDRLQRAKRQRAEYLMQRGRQQSSIRGNWNKMHEQADVLSRKLARCWREFLKLRKTTLFLAKTYSALNLNERSVKTMPFEQLALLIESTATLQTTKAFLDRLENRYKLSRVFANPSPGWDDIDHLLKRVASPKRRATTGKSLRSRDAKKPASARQPLKTSLKLSRYQVRVVLCAYMILGHPDAVLSGQGEREVALARSAERFVIEFERLIKIILDGPLRNSEFSDAISGGRQTFKLQLAAFDSAWCSYLNSFVVWKVKDARSLEDDLVRAACQLELSMIQTCKMTPEGESGSLTHDMKAIQKQVTDDQKLLREKVLHLSGDAGIERMENALSDTRMKYFKARESRSPAVSPVNQISSFSSSSSDASPPLNSPDERRILIEGGQRSSHVVRSLFKDEMKPNEAAPSTPSGSSSLYPVERLDLDNELIVNESVHGQHFEFADELQSDVKGKVREAMENAFWDGIMDLLKKDEPEYSRIVDLMREVRDEICAMAPQSWKQEIIEEIDLDILSQVLTLGRVDMDYLRRVMEFTLLTLLKLSSPAVEEELKATHQKLMKELGEVCQAGDGSEKTYAIALVRGLRFVLGQIQELKREISKARIRMLEPFLKGPAALEYLRKAFSKRHGSPDDAMASLPLTISWLSSVRGIKDQEWSDHTNAQFNWIRSHESSSQRFLPSTTLRSGGNNSVNWSLNATNSTAVIDQQSECKGEKVDLFVRLGILKLASRVSGMTQEGLPETLELNFFRLRSAQAKIQKIIVIATSILVLRQIIFSDLKASCLSDMENLVLTSVKKLSKLLDSVEDAGIKDIVEVLSKVVENNVTSLDTAKLQSVKEIIARMLTRSLQAGDGVFARVSGAIYSATRGIVLGGNGTCGKKLAEIALRQVGATALIDELVETASVLLVAATVSVNVHGPWYARLMEQM